MPIAAAGGDATMGSDVFAIGVDPPDAAGALYVGAVGGRSCSGNERCE